MDAGLCVPLDPDGGNQLNVRELLRLLQPASATVPDDADDAGMEEGMLPSSAAEREVEPPGRRTVHDDYDYDDDFIDDAELVEEEHDAPQIEEEYDESADDDFRPDEQQGASESEEDPSGDGGAQNTSKTIVPAAVHHGFGQFFVNKGDIPSKVKLKPVHPSSKLGNVSLKHIKFPTSQSSTPVTPAAVTPSAEKPAQNPEENPAKKLPSGAGDVLAKKKNVDSPSTPARAGSAGSSAAKSKPMPSVVLVEIAKLAKVCQEEFGDKKPKLNDPKVQDQLHIVFKTAMEGGVARLFSDIAKDKRIVSLSDDVWVRLSRFLRTKRPNLEQLGHALVWSAREKSAKGRVAKTEGIVDAFMKERLKDALDHPDDPSKGKFMEWTDEADGKLHDWYRARCDLQNAKNQLGSRVKSIKKAMPAWVAAIRAKSFVGFAASEQDIMDSYRRVEDARQVQERRKRDAERLERKRRKEEQAAAVAAKRAATAQAKSLAVSNSKASATPDPSVPSASLTHGSSTEATPKPVKIVKTVPKPGASKPNSAKNGTAKPSGVKPAIVKPGASKTNGAKIGNVKSGTGKSAPGKTTPVRVTPVKVTAAKAIKNGGATPGPGGGSAQKQVKLTAMMKKTAKVEGVAGGQAGKGPGSSAGGSSKKSQAAKYTRPVVAVKASAQVAGPGKPGAGKGTGPKVIGTKGTPSKGGMSKMTSMKGTASKPPGAKGASAVKAGLAKAPLNRPGNGKGTAAHSEAGKPVVAIPAVAKTQPIGPGSAKIASGRPTAHVAGPSSVGVGNASGAVLSNIQTTNRAGPGPVGMAGEARAGAGAAGAVAARDRGSSENKLALATLLSDDAPVRPVGGALRMTPVGSSGEARAGALSSPPGHVGAQVRPGGSSGEGADASRPDFEVIELD